MSQIITWERTYSARRDAWTAFLRAASIFGGTAPGDVDPAELGALASPAAIVTALERTYSDITLPNTEGNIAPAPFRIGIEGGAISVAYGSGRTSVTLRDYPSVPPYDTQIWVIVQGPVEAIASISARVVAAGGPAWDLTSDWHPVDGWRGVPLDAQDRAAEFAAAAH